MEALLKFAAWLANILWQTPTLLLIGTVAVVLTIGKPRLPVPPVRLYHEEHGRQAQGKGAAGSGNLSPFQACCIALASTVGTGNIAGVATAISIGGPGAIFWMWLMALLGMISKTAEVTLAVHYREKDDNGVFHGGPMYYMRKGLGWGALAKVFCVGLIVNSLLTAGLLQQHTAARAFLSTWNINPYITAGAMAFVCGVVIIGGLKRIGSFCEYCVPIMAIAYVLGGLVIMIVNFEKIPEVFGMIFKYAFAPAPAMGGFAGSVVATSIQRGISRGMMSNEAGQGSAPMAHATAAIDHPVEQGVWARSKFLWIPSSSARSRLSSSFRPAFWKAACPVSISFLPASIPSSREPLRVASFLRDHHLLPLLADRLLLVC